MRSPVLLVAPPVKDFLWQERGLANDPRNKLYKEYLRVVRYLEPKTVVFENVPGFATRYGLGLRGHLENSLRKMGYEIASGVVRAMDYGGTAT